MESILVFILGVLWTIGALIFARVGIHFIYLIVIYNERRWRKERIIENVRKMERGF